MFRVAHINNPAGVPTTLATEQKVVGYKAQVFLFNERIHKMFEGGTLVATDRLSIYRLLLKLKVGFDVWHYHSPGGGLLRNIRRAAGGKKVLYHFHGSDLRKMGHYDDFCLVSTPDLLSRTPNGIWIPNPLDFTIYDNYRKPFYDEDPPKVIHYPPYKVQSSIEDVYSKPLTELEKEGKIKLITTMNFTYDELMEHMSSSTIVTGKVRSDMGWFGKFELEGMALGRPVIAFVSDELYDKYRPPIYRTTRETFKRDLMALLEDSKTRQRLGREGFEYVKNQHDVKKTVKSLEKYYK